MYDAIIIGCGVSGAAIAYEFSKYQLKTAILEKENDVSLGATKANSAIFHAGYDPKPGTLMAKLNVRGVALAKELCEKLDVPYKQCGALVLAFGNEDIQTLEALKARGDANGVEGLRLLDAHEALHLEPGLSQKVVAALYAPTSAICSPWEYCLALAETAVRNGAELFLNAPAERIERRGGGWLVTAGGRSFETRYVINAAGLAADRVHDLALPHDFTIEPARGQYYLMDKAEAIRVARTIFQCPSRLGKGILVTPTVHGNLLVGPDAETVVGNDTSTTAEGLAHVAEMASMSVPSINYRNCIRNFAGVRARTSNGDFIIREAEKGFIDVAGICSPGLSAAAAIGEYVAELAAASGLELKKKEDFVCERKKLRFKHLPETERAALVAKDPAYGRVICRCETVTEGEIRASFDSPIPPVSVDGVKRRAGTGMGRCQGGFCGPQIVKLLAEHYGVSEDKIVQERAASWMLLDKEDR